jgi:hypothetical protein
MQSAPQALTLQRVRLPKSAWPAGWLVPHAVKQDDPLDTQAIWQSRKLAQSLPFPQAATCVGQLTPPQTAQAPASAGGAPVSLASAEGGLLEGPEPLSSLEASSPAVSSDVDPLPDSVVSSLSEPSVVVSTVPGSAPDIAPGAEARAVARSPSRSSPQAGSAIRARGAAIALKRAPVAAERSHSRTRVDAGSFIWASRADRS